jgi:hypothetical protein
MRIVRRKRIAQNDGRESIAGVAGRQGPCLEQLGFGGGV